LCLAAAIAERTSIQEALMREKKLRLAQEQYRMIIETTNDGVWIIDDQDRTTFVNRRMAEMFGYRPEEMLGHTPFDYLFPEDVPQKKADLERRRRGTGREVLYNRFRRKDGSEMWATLSTAPLFTESGKRSGALAMLSDVTMLRQAEDSLRRNEKLITAGRLAATISHELNNPLEAVVNLLYLLKMQPLNDQAMQYLDLSEKEVQRITTITRRTLGFFRDNSAWVELAVTDLLEDTLAFYEQRLADHSIRVVRDYRDRGTVSASRSELQQVFANLISNALDAMNGSGRLTLRVSTASDNSGTEVVVEDDGAGIAADHLNRVFEPFFTTKQSTGTGLGLWVAKEIIHKHGGTISVSSKSGSGDEHGTRISIFLPRTVNQRAAA
jgi:PAS domain S-box-containing protein